jgi:uncharacterized protein with beta-barrel porin domain
MLGRRHVAGDMTPTFGMAFAGARSSPPAIGPPIARDAVVLEVGRDGPFTKYATIGAFNSGALASHDEDNAIKAKLDIAF